MIQEFDQQLTIALYVRADAPTVERRDAVIDRLKRLERQNRIAEFRIHPCPRAISLGLVKQLEGEGIHELVRSVQTWAAQHDRHISPPFDIHTSHSAITGESDELLVMPVMWIAAYVSGDLVGVAPSSEEESAHTLENARGDIEAGNTPIQGTHPEAETSTPRDEQRKSSRNDTDDITPDHTGQ